MSGWNNPLPIGQSSGALCGGPGEKCAWLLGGHSSLCTDRRATCTYRTTSSQELRTSMLATTRILVCKLATARVFCLPTANQHTFFLFSGSHISSPPSQIDSFQSDSCFCFPSSSHFHSRYKAWKWGTLRRADIGDAEDSGALARPLKGPITSSPASVTESTTHPAPKYLTPGLSVGLITLIYHGNAMPLQSQTGIRNLWSSKNKRCDYMGSNRNPQLQLFLRLSSSIPIVVTVPAASSTLTTRQPTQSGRQHNSTIIPFLNFPTAHTRNDEIS